MWDSLGIICQTYLANIYSIFVQTSDIDEKSNTKQYFTSIYWSIYLQINRYIDDR